MTLFVTFPLNSLDINCFSIGHFEFPPYSDSHMRSVYHLREYEVFRMLHLTGRMASDPLDIFLSHDWPAGVWNYGDVNQLLRIKPYFAADMEKGELGSPPLWHILQTLQPDFWFSAHLHVKFAAIVPHNQQTYTAEPIKKNDEEIDIDDMQEDESTTPMSICSPQVPAKSTRFLALDKVIPGR